MAREYTGTKDGAATGKRAGLEEFVRQVATLSGGSLWNNGTWVVRNMRGKESLSVHATGRAVDMSWRKVGDKGVVNGRQAAQRTIRRLIQNGDLLQIECVLDYFPEPHGRGWRCDRESWQTYQRPTISGAGGGDWYHIEIAPKYADDAAAYRRLFQQLTPETH